MAYNAPYEIYGNSGCLLGSGHSKVLLSGKGEMREPLTAFMMNGFDCMPMVRRTVSRATTDDSPLREG